MVRIIHCLNVQLLFCDLCWINGKMLHQPGGSRMIPVARHGKEFLATAPGWPRCESATNLSSVFISFRSAQLWCSLQETVDDGHQRYIKRRRRPAHPIAVSVSCLLLQHSEYFYSLDAIHLCDFKTKLKIQHSLIWRKLCAGTCHTTEVSAVHSLQVSEIWSSLPLCEYNSGLHTCRKLSFYGLVHPIGWKFYVLLIISILAGCSFSGSIPQELGNLKLLSFL